MDILINDMLKPTANASMLVAMESITKVNPLVGSITPFLEMSPLKASQIVFVNDPTAR